jgi:hypothetical protein
MARPNKTGISFKGWQLEKHEEHTVKKYLKDKEISANQLIRYLIRKLLTDENLVPTTKKLSNETKK